MKTITDPVRALVEVGKENSQLHEEQARTWAELDHYRNALTAITTMKDCPTAVRVALNALAGRRLDA
jgi:hypothetical protein